MVTRLSKETKAVATALLPLAIGVSVASVVSVLTLSWGDNFLLWQLSWWLFSSVVLGFFAFNSPVRLEGTRFARWVIQADRASFIFLLSGLGIAIYIMVAGDVTTAPFAAYWPFSVAAWLIGAAGLIRSNANERLENQVNADRAVFHADLHNIDEAAVYIMSDRQERWENADEAQKIKQRVAFEGQFLQALYLAAKGGIRSVQLGSVWVCWNLYLSPEGAQLRNLLSRLDDVEHRYPDKEFSRRVFEAGWYNTLLFFHTLKEIKGAYLLAYGADVSSASRSYKYFRDLDDMTENALPVWRERGDVKFEGSLSGSRSGSVYPSMQVSLTARGVDLCRRAEEVGSIQEALREREAGYRVEKQININNSQISGVVGTDNIINGRFEQHINVIDHIPLDRLADELHALTGALRHDLEQNRAIPGIEEQANAVANAAEAADNGDRRGAIRYLAQAGKWALDTAKQIGTELAVEAIKTILKAHNIPL